MLVSVMMPAFNAGRYIEQSLRSLFVELGDVQLDVIVVDDGSTDNTIDVVREFARRRPEVRLIEAPHGGISVTRNRALDALPADTQFVTFQDADDVAYPGRIARQMARMHSAERPDVVYGMLEFVDLLDDETLLPTAAARTLSMRTIQLSCGLYRRSVLDQVGRFDELLVQAEDTDFLFRLVESGARILMEDENATFYRRHDTNTTRDVLGARREFMKAIHKSVKRRRQSAGQGRSLASSIFTERAQFEEQFATCATLIPS